jgi:hypothetical protein
MSDAFLQLIDGVFELTDDLDTTGGLETALVLTIAGGNSQDGGRPVDADAQWWGNRLEVDATRHVRSRFDTATTGAPVTTSYVRRATPEVSADLTQLVEAGELTEFTTTFVIPEVNRVQLTITTDTLIFTQVFNGGTTT